ncbi:MAG: SpoIIIAC/SpoIIIAD family protein [Eubacteriales bacterium]|jgi:stage III sporulation protein AD|nr:SpoIIIAC/SpoIIIAD family protein [Eubacteriales bacterium]
MDIDIFKLCGAAIASVMLIMLIRQAREEFSPLMSFAVCVVLFAAAIITLQPVIAYIREITSDSLLAPYTGTLLKALGIGMVTQTTAEICRDSEENAIAGKVEFLGKAEIVLLSLPLLGELLDLAGRVMDV